jgi:hypothetical protein
MSSSQHGSEVFDCEYHVVVSFYASTLLFNQWLPKTQLKDNVAKGRRKPWQVKLLKTKYFCPLPFAVRLYEISRHIYVITL